MEKEPIQPILLLTTSLHAGEEQSTMCKIILAGKEQSNYVQNNPGMGRTVNNNDTGRSL